jgi:uncharacterized protein YaaN involved in tellurite resistance
MISMLKFDEYMSNKIKPAYKAGKIKDEEDLHYKLSKFVSGWLKKELDSKAPMIVEEALFEFRESINVLNLVQNMGDGMDFDYETLEAYWTAISVMLDYEIDTLSKTFEKLANHYPDTKQKYIKSD